MSFKLHSYENKIAYGNLLKTSASINNVYSQKNTKIANFGL